MEPFSKIDNTFHQLRKMPDEMPLEKVEQFVLAQAAIGITAAGSSSVLKKLLLKFHLNSIIIMTTTVTASLISLFIWTTGGHKQAQTKNKFPAHNSNSYQSTFIGSKPELSLSVDTPTTSIHQTESSTSIQVTTETKSKKIATTNITVEAKGDSVITTVYTSGSDSVHVYGNEKGNAAQQKIVIKKEANIPPIDVIDVEKTMGVVEAMDVTAVTNAVDAVDAMASTDPTLPDMAWTATTPCSAKCSHTDSLQIKVEQQLLKDGLIKDSRHYAFKMTGNSLKVNGEKQSTEVWKRYKEIVETNSDTKVNRKFIYAISVDGDSISIDIEN